MAKRVVVPTAQLLYGALDEWRERCLASEGSLFTPSTEVWTAPAFGELNRLFVEQPDLSSRSFMEKLEVQLEDGTPTAVQLMAELLYVHVVITVTIGGPKKREIVEQVLGWMPSPPAIPTELSAALDKGLVNPGTYYLTGRDRALAFLITFGGGWTALPSEDRVRYLADPWAFREWVWTLDVGSAYSQRNALLHLVHPDAFEAITSDDHKKLILDRFAGHIPDRTLDIDRQLWEARRALEDEHGRDFDYYSPSLVRIWRDPQGDWAAFVRWAAEFYAMPDFDAQERDYKVAAAANLAEAGAAIRDDAEDWLVLLRKAMGNQNLTAWQADDRFLKWADGHRTEAREALLQIYGPDDVTTEALGAFLDHLPKSAARGVGTRTNVASLLLTGRDPLNFPIYKPDPFRVGYELTGVKAPGAQTTETQRYASAVSFLEQFVEEAREAGLELRDLLDAQSLLWCIAKWPPLETWSADKKQAFLAFRGEAVPPVAETNQEPAGQESVSSPESLDELERALFLESGALTRIRKLLEHRRQVVFQGPPGTGKTYVARALANQLAGADGSVTLVQFHPSYSYEDFVEGYRPQAKGTFDLKPGPLRKVARLAEERPEGTHILLIDEINRANLAKVMGELYYLLEYRSEQINLQYSEDAFSLPRNLWIIGTMNTADRSIAIVDGALRRRFHFIDFYPDQPPVGGVLRRWLAATNPDLLWVDDLVALANEMLDDREVAIGPSHFMKADYDEEWIELIWEHSVHPYVREQLFGQEDRWPEFRFGALRERLDPSAAEPTPEDASAEGQDSEDS